MARDRQRASGERRSKSRSRSGRRKATKSAPPTKRGGSSGSSSASADEEAPLDAEDAEDLSLEARVALLEVENATLKAENAELRKKLVEALRKPSAQAPASGREPAARRAEAAAPKPSPAETQPKAEVREEEQKGSRRRGSEASRPPPAAQEPEEDDDHRNAVLLVNSQVEAYNEPIANNIVPEKRIPLVDAKAKRFFEHFSDKIEIIDIKSNSKVIKDRKTFEMRYLCVFRESGAKLRCETRKRFYYDAKRGATYCLDFETHEHLVTAMAGTKPDGSLGVRPARTENLVVLYEESKGKISRMWLAQDADKIGIDPKVGEERLAASAIVRKFEEKIAEVRDGPPHERIFQNYLEIPTVG